MAEGWSQAEIERMIAIHDYADGEPVAECVSCGQMVEGYYWKLNRCGRCGGLVRPVEEWEQVGKSANQQRGGGDDQVYVGG